MTDPVPPPLTDDDQARRQVKHSLAQAHDAHHDGSPCWDHCLDCAPLYNLTVPTRGAIEQPRPPDVAGGALPPGPGSRPGDPGPGGPR